MRKNSNKYQQTFLSTNFAFPFLDRLFHFKDISEEKKGKKKYKQTKKNYNLKLNSTVLEVTLL